MFAIEKFHAPALLRVWARVQFHEMPVPPRSEWTIYQALWRAAEAQGAFVCYTDRDDGFEGGMFHVFNGSPR
ncbi:hypothetical protein, partial [Salmonella enterica]|uniref:hypothetical protein n=1 Tax=Salmonella enterica TaxID=28901 RepID=UPI003CF4ACE0